MGPTSWSIWECSGASGAPECRALEHCPVLQMLEAPGALPQPSGGLEIFPSFAETTINEITVVIQVNWILAALRCYSITPDAMIYRWCI